MASASRPAPARWLAPLGVEREAQEVSARVFSYVWAAGALSSWLTLAVPSLPVGNRSAILVAALVATAMAAFSRWSASRPAVAPYSAAVSLLVGLPLGAVVIALTGGPGSAGRFVLFLPVVFVAWAFPLRSAVPWVFLTLAVFAAPVTYSSGPAAARFIAELLVVLPAYLVLAVGVIVVKRRLVELRRRAERLAAEQGALRRVATAATRGSDAEAVHRVVAGEAAALLRVSAAVVLRAGREQTTITGSWSERGSGCLPRGSVLTGSPESAASAALGGEDVLVAPVRVDGTPWGALAARRGQDALPDAERRLRDLGELLGLALASLEARERLAAQALTDPLTALANRRAFQDRLGEEVERARRGRLPLCVAVIDCDDLKTVNDESGHEAGDELLVAVATALKGLARGGDLLARIGGDEFAWILPDVHAPEALRAVERVIAAVATIRAGRASVCAGVDELRELDGPEALLRRADLALYRAKGAGRGTARLFEPADGRDARPGVLTGP